jgi:hypothetical protein
MGGFRAVVMVFAVFLACQAFWILAPELSRPSLIASPHDTASAPDLTANRKAAHLAAQFGMVRGYLWAQDALTYGEFRRGEQTDARSAEEARDAVEKALLFAPHDARIWLALANINSRLGGLDEKAFAALRMSFYTGPNEVQLIPTRLLLSLASPAISDKGFQQLAVHDLRTIVTRKPELKPAISNAYQYASPGGQQFIRDTLKDLDPNLLSSLPQKRPGD